MEDGTELRLRCLLYPDNLVLCSESEEDGKAMVCCCVEVCGRGLKVSVGERKVMVLNGDEGLE